MSHAHRSPSRRRSRRIVVDLDRLLAIDPELRERHRRCTDRGMSLRPLRVWQRRDGGFSVRAVWSRHDGANTTSIVYSCTYVPEAGDGR